MALLSTTFTDDFLTCSICYEIYKEPKTLPCLHSFCKECILQFIQKECSNKPYNCPICRESFLINERGLKTNFCLQNMIDVIKKTDFSNILCSFCKLMDENQPAVSQCLTCLDFLCKKCSEQRHTFTRQTKDHRVVPLEDVKEGKYDNELRSAQKTPCMQHGSEILRYFCIQCNLSVCRDCIIFDHRNHDCKLISDARKEKEEQIENVISPLREKLKALQSNNDLLGRQMEEITCREFMIKEKIEKVYREAIRSIQTTQKKTEKELTERLKSAKMQLKMLCDRSTEVSNSIEESIKFSVEIMKKGNDVEVVSLLDEIIERLTKLNHQNVIQECEVPSIDVPDFQIRWEEPQWILFTSENYSELHPKLQADLPQCENKKQIVSKEINPLSGTSTEKMSSSEKYFNSMPKPRSLSENIDSMQGKIHLELVKAFPITESEDRRSPVYSSVAWTNDGRLIAIDKENSKIKMLTISSGLINSVKVKNAVGISTSKCLLACRTTDSCFIFFDLNLKEQNRIKDVMTAIPHSPDGDTLAWMSKNKIYIKSEDNIIEKDILDDNGNAKSLSKPQYASSLPNNTVVISDWGDDCVYFLDEHFRIFRKIDTYPGSVSYDSKANVYITDYHNNCLFLYDSKGTFITQLKVDQFQSSPRSIAIWKDTALVASKGQVCMYDIIFET